MRWRGALAGSLAAASALAISELAAGVVTAVPSLVESVGGVAIDNVPPGVKDWAITTFGTNDKLALIIGIIVVSVVLGSVVGVLARRRMWVATVVFAGFGLVGAVAGVSMGGSVVGSSIGGGLAAAVGLTVLVWLYSRAERDDERATAGDQGRRAFIVGVGAVIALAAGSAGAGRALLERAKRSVAGRDQIVLPVAAEPVMPPPAAASLQVPQITPLVTPNPDFYRIDTALSVPQVDLESWELRVHGMVDRPYTLTFDDLMEMDMVERYVTLSCVSNEVGGGLIGNAKWLGVPLTEILDRAGPQDGADQLVGRAVDQFTVGFPTSVVYDGRDTMVAVGMNDEPLPLDHGFPARLVVAGLYGYVSATKWLSEIELTTWDSFDAYWVPRGWSKEGPIKTQSRIDTPRPRSVIEAGERAVAGVAWAPNVGIDRVEVQIDGGDWAEATMAEPLDENCWRQWTHPWDATSGDHTIAVRATDATGYTQTSELARPAPNGATGWHTIDVTVT